MFESCMWKYIQEEKKVLSKLLHTNNIQNEMETLKSIESIYFIAHGSSYNACRSMAPIVSRYAKVRTYVYTPSNFDTNSSIQYEPKEKCAILSISQTGTSRGVLEALQKVSEYKKIIVTNEENSPMDKIGDITYLLQVGQENSNAKTKGYSASLLILFLFALELGSVKGYISILEKEKILQDVQNEIEALDMVFSNTVNWCTQHQYGKGMNNVCVLGNGMQYGSALEGSLKLMETMCIPTVFNDIIEFSHGMHRYLHKDSYVILLNGIYQKELMKKTYFYCKDRNIPVLLINGSDFIEDEYSIHVGKYPYTDSIFSIVCAIQVISVFAAEINNLDPNREANDDYTEEVKTRV